MDRRTMEESAKKFCKTLEYLIGKEDWSAADTEWAKNAISGMEKLCKMGYDEEYSQRGYYSRTGIPYDYGMGNSYRSYSRDSGYSMRDHLDRMMDEAPDERTREKLRRFKMEFER